MLNKVANQSRRQGDVVYDRDNAVAQKKACDKWPGLWVEAFSAVSR
jgi:hypothetical protein